MTTAEPSDHASGPVSASHAETFVPGQFVPKLIYLILAGIVSTIGFWFAWEPTRAILFGEIVEARVAEIHELVPGREPRVFRYRKNWAESDDFRTIYQHYLSINIEGAPVLYRLSVDSRRAPAAQTNVNDKITIAYRKEDPRRLAFEIYNPRTWGGAALFGSIGGVMLATAIPMLIAVGKPIRLDPEAPRDEPEDDDAAAEQVEDELRNGA